MSCEARLPVTGRLARRRSRRAALQDLGRSGVLAALGMSGAIGHQRPAAAYAGIAPRFFTGNLVPNFRDTVGVSS